PTAVGQITSLYQNYVRPFCDKYSTSVLPKNMIVSACGLTPSRPAVGEEERSPILTIFWHCGHTAFSSRTTAGRRFRQRTVNGFGRRFRGLEGSGNADSQAFGWSSGRGDDARACDSGCCEPAHPASWRASPSYRPLRAVWAVCAWALRGCARTPKPFSAHGCSATYPKGTLP